MKLRHTLHSFLFLSTTILNPFMYAQHKKLENKTVFYIPTDYKNLFLSSILQLEPIDMLTTISSLREVNKSFHNFIDNSLQNNKAVTSSVQSALSKVKIYNHCVTLGKAIDAHALNLVKFLFQNNNKLKRYRPPEFALYRATKSRHLGIVKVILKNGANIDDWGHNKRPIYLAAQNGDIEIVKVLLHHGVKINATIYNDRTPIHIAAKNGHTEIVKLLLEHGADINAKAWSKTPLHIAIKNGHLEIVRLLLQNRVNDESWWSRGQSLEHAIKSGNVGIVRLLFQYYQPNYFIGTYLHIAAKNGYTEIVKYLLEHGAFVNTADKGGETPLHVAVQNGHIGTVRLLLKHNADVYAITKEKKDTPLHLATQNGYKNMVLLLLPYYSQPTPKRSLLQLTVKNNHKEIILYVLQKKETPLHFAAKNGLFGMMQFLLSQNKYLIYVNSFDPWRKTPLIHAARRGHTEIVRILLENNANVQACKNKRVVPLHLASKYGHSEIVQLLIKYNANVNSNTIYGIKPLHYAASYGHINIVRLLIKNKANIDVYTRGNYTPLDFAEGKNHGDIVQILKPPKAQTQTKGGNQTQTEASFFRYVNHFKPSLAIGKRFCNIFLRYMFILFYKKNIIYIFRPDI